MCWVFYVWLLEDVIDWDRRNMLSKVSLFVRPKSPISSKISSKFLIFVQMLLSYWKVFNLQMDKYVLISKSI